MKFVEPRPFSTDLYVRDELWGAGDPYGVRQFVGVSRVVDIGANIGMFTLLACHLWPDASVEAYEPEPSNFAELCANIDANDLAGRVEVHQDAVWADDGGTIVDPHFGLSRTGHGAMPCQTVTLDDVIDGRRVDVLKVDTEGAEFTLFPPCTQMNLVRFFTMEFHDINSPQARDGLLEFLAQTHTLETNLVDHVGGMVRGWLR